MDGCGEVSPHDDWYEEIEVEKPKSFFSSIFSKKNDNLPVTDNDKKWIEHSLIFLSDLFEPVYFKSLITITPEKKYFDRDFTGTEEDAEFIFERIISIMHIDSWEIQLMFFSNEPTGFSAGITATSQEKLKGSWKSSAGLYIDRGLGKKEIWIELSKLIDPESLIATISHELAHYKLLGEHRIEKNDELLTDLTAIAFGFGIFSGNSYFKFSQWHGNTHHGWAMRKSGYLPEQVIAYAMAWLAHYRNEDLSWKQYLNKTMRKYFEQSYEFIGKNKDSIKWSN